MSAIKFDQVWEDQRMPSNNGLPEGWAVCRLKSISTKITKGATPTSYGFKYQTSGIKFVKVENIKDGSIDHNSIRHFISEEANLNQSRSILMARDLLFSIAGTIGATCLVLEQDLPANTNQALAIIRGTCDVVLPGFLQLQLGSKVIIHQIIDQARGGSMNNVSLADVGNIEIFIPPLAEQKRIVAKVDELLARVNVVRERLARVKEILKRFRQSVLAAACSGRLTADWREKNSDIEPASKSLEEIRQQHSKIAVNVRTKKKVHIPDSQDLAELPAKWVWTTVGNISDRIHYGYTAKSESAPVGPKLLRITDIQNDKVNWENVPYCKIDEKEKPKYLLEDGDFVFARTGATVGKNYLLCSKFPASVFASYLIRIIINERISKEFVSIFFKSSAYWRQITSDQIGIGQPNVNAQILSKIILPLPPPLEQMEIVKRINALFSLTDRIEKLLAAAGERAERLTQAILAKTFRGELVPTEAELAREEGRSYEPASVLLTKIKTQREDIKPQQKHKRANPQEA